MARLMGCRGLRHRVTFQRVTETRAADGGVTQTWATLAQRFAEIERRPGSEVTDGQAQEGRAPAEFRFRAVSGLTPKDRITFGSRVYEIIDVRDADNEKGLWDVVSALEVV